MKWNPENCSGPFSLQAKAMSIEMDEFYLTEHVSYDVIVIILRNHPFTVWVN